MEHIIYLTIISTLIYGAIHYATRKKRKRVNRYHSLPSDTPIASEPVDDFIYLHLGGEGKHPEYWWHQRSGYQKIE